MKRGTLLFLKASIFIIGIIILALCLFWLPAMARTAAEIEPVLAYLKFPVLFGMYVTAVPFFIALYQAYKLVNFIERREAFSVLAVHSLGWIKTCAIAIILLYVIGLFFLGSQSALHPGIALMGLVIIFATVVISLFTAVLQELLRSVLDIKTENDLTV